MGQVHQTEVDSLEHTGVPGHLGLGWWLSTCQVEAQQGAGDSEKGLWEGEP